MHISECYLKLGKVSSLKQLLSLLLQQLACLLAYQPLELMNIDWSCNLTGVLHLWQGKCPVANSLQTDFPWICSQKKTHWCWCSQTLWYHLLCCCKYFELDLVEEQLWDFSENIQVKTLSCLRTIFTSFLLWNRWFLSQSQYTPSLILFIVL